MAGCKWNKVLFHWKRRLYDSRKIHNLSDSWVPCLISLENPISHESREIRREIPSSGDEISCNTVFINQDVYLLCNVVFVTAVVAIVVVCYSCHCWYCCCRRRGRCLLLLLLLLPFDIHVIADIVVVFVVVIIVVVCCSCYCCCCCRRCRRCRCRCCCCCCYYYYCYRLIFMSLLILSSSPLLSFLSFVVIPVLTVGTCHIPAIRELYENLKPKSKNIKENIIFPSEFYQS